MISKISINQVASYREPAVLENAKPINLIYGLNGSGKTTISKYLSKPENESYTQCRIEKANGDDFLLRVYNQEFVEEVFFNKDTQNGIFTLSKENKDVEQKLVKKGEDAAKLNIEVSSLREKIEKIDKSIEDRTTKDQEACFQIKQKHTGGDRILDSAEFLKGFKTKAPLFNHLLSLDKTDSARSIDEIKNEVEQLQKSGDQGADLLPELPGSEDFTAIEGDSILAEAIVGRSNSSLSGLIEHLENSDWFTQGLEYMPATGDKCPFCQQALNSALKSEIENYLDADFKAKVQQVKNLKSKYSAHLEVIPEWQAFDQCEFIEKRESLKSQYEGLIAKLRKNLSDISRKHETPSQVFTISKTDVKFAEINTLIDETNSRIKSHNQKILDKKNSLAALKKEFWQNQRNEYESILTSHQKEVKKLQAEKEKLEKDHIARIEDLRGIEDEVRELQKQTVNIEETVTNINGMLRDCGLVGFKLVREGERYYRISRDEEGSSEKVFSTLSEGEKTMISFFYFLELCKGKSEPGETLPKVIVIDDPISSLSHLYVFNIAQLIKREFTNAQKVKGAEKGSYSWALANGSRYKQCFVLTHSLYFFFELADTNHERRKELQSLYRVAKGLTGSTIYPMSYSEIQNDYQSYWSVIRDPDSHPALLANCMRNVIEYFFGFIEKKELSNIFPPDLDDRFQSFYRYINKESHSFSQNIFDTKEFDYSIFKEGLKLVFEANGYSGHYAKMMGA